MAKVINHFLPKPPNLGTKTVTENGTVTAASEGLDGFSQVTVNVASGGDTGTIAVKFFDYDGTLLKIEYVAEGMDATPPTVPTHEDLDFQEWVGTYTNVTHDVCIGAIYTTKEMTINGWTGRPWILKGECTVATGKTFYISIGFNGLSKATIVDEAFNVLGEVSGYSSTEGLTITLTDYGEFKLYLYPSYINRPGIDYCYWNGSTNTYAIKEINIGNTMTSSSGAIYGNFQQMHALEKISIPNTLTYIGGGFSSGHSLTCIIAKIYSGANVNSNGCYSLKTIILPNLSSDWKSDSNNIFGYCWALENINIESVKGIGTNTFFECKSIKKLYLPNVTTINSSAFKDMNALEVLYAPKLKYITSPTSTSSVYQGCYNIKNIIIPIHMAEMDTNFARYCTQIENVELHEKISKIDSYAFYETYKLKSAIFKRALTDESIYTVAAGLTVTTSKTITGYVVGGTRGVVSVYNNTTGLEVTSDNYTTTTSSQITFTAGVSEGDSVTIVILTGITIMVDDDVFNIPSSYYSHTLKIYVPDRALEVYKAATNWSLLSNFLYPISDTGVEDTRYYTEEFNGAGVGPYMLGLEPSIKPVVTEHFTAKLNGVDIPNTANTDFSYVWQAGTSQHSIVFAGGSSYIPTTDDLLEITYKV